MATALESLMYNWINDSLVLNNFSGVTVIRESQEGPEAEGPLVTYNILTKTPEAYGTFEKRELEVPTEEDMEVEHRKRNEVVVSVNAYADNGGDILDILVNSWKSYEIRQPLIAAGVGYVSSAVNAYLPIRNDTRYEPRYHQDFKFLAWTTYLEVRPKVKTIEIGGTVHNV